MDGSNHRSNPHPSNAPSVRLARRGGSPVAPELCAPADGQREYGPLRLVVRQARQSYSYWSFNSSHVFGFHSRANRWAPAICWEDIKSARSSRASENDFALAPLALDATRLYYMCA